MKRIMKNKIYKFLLPAIAVMVTILSCSEDFLEVQPKGTFLTENYYSNQDEAFAGLVAAYDFLRKNSGCFENMVTMMNAGSDDFYAGGGNSTDGIGIQNFSNYKLNAIENKVNDLVTFTATHTHTGVTAGGGTSGTTATPVTGSLTPTQISDIEDQQIKH